MARKRMIDPSIWASTTFEGLSCNDARLLVIWLFSNADDEGRLRGSLPVIRGSAFAFCDGITNAHIDGWLNELANLGFLVRYQAEGYGYLQLCKWHEYQKIDKPSPSHLPAPTDTDMNTSRILDEGSPNTPLAIVPNRMEWKEIEQKGKAGKPATRLSPPLPDYASLKGKIPEGRIRSLWADYEAMCAGRRASNTIAESVLCAMLSKLLDKIATDGITPEAVCYGLEAAIMKQADNINYVLNAARGHNPPGKMPDKPPPKATQLFKPKPGVEVSEAI